MNEVNGEQLVQIIGQKQVEIEFLRAQVKALSEAYELQRKTLEEQNAQASLWTPGEPAPLEIAPAPKRSRKS